MYDKKNVKSVMSHNLDSASPLSQTVTPSLPLERDVLYVRPLTPLPIDPGSENSPSILTLIFFPMYIFPINILFLQIPIYTHPSQDIYQHLPIHSIKRLLVVHRAYVYFLNPDCFLIFFQSSFVGLQWHLWYLFPS